MGYKSIYLATALTLGVVSAAPAPPQYPLVKTQHWAIAIPNVQHANVHISIRSSQGKPLYSLECHGAGHSDQSFDYSGDFECRLLPLDRVTRFSTLFTEDEKQSRDWESRARFFSRNLRGKCARVPEFGSRRTFRLRGMRIGLSVLHPTFKGTELETLILDVSVSPDGSARSPITMRVPFPKKAPGICRLQHFFP